MNFTILGLILINFLLTKKGFDDQHFFNKYKFHIGSIQSGEKYRMLSSGFLHVDWNHFIFNMLTLYFFGPFIIAHLGKFHFLLIYFTSLVVGNLISYKVHEREINYSAVGASGAIMGIIYATILLAPHSKIYFFFILPMPSYIFGLLYLLYSIYGLKNIQDGIGHAAHIGGAIAGYISILLLETSVFFHNKWIALLLLLPILYFLYSIKTNKN